MARIRTVKPEFWKDEELALLPRDYRLFYIATWNEADDHGRLRGNPVYLKGVVFPYDEDFGPKEILAAIEALETRGKLIRYESAKGEKFIQLTQFSSHQKIDKRYPSKLPVPPIRPDKSGRPANTTQQEQGTGNRDQGGDAPRTPAGNTSKRDKIESLKNKISKGTKVKA